jgi:2,3-bisphosphoglycerate-independent phosphoglycerate mutase
MRRGTSGGKRYHNSRPAGRRYPLGVPGLPQSATGQTTLWTGVNAAAAAGRHINAYPTRALKEILARAGILGRVLALGKSAIFANAYGPEYEERVAQGKRKHSTSTVMTVSAGLPLKTLTDLCHGRAVYQDITNTLLIARGHRVPLFTPGEAGERLAALAADYDFTLFEYFQTDRIGHQQDMVKAVSVIEVLDCFLEAVINRTDLRHTLVMVVSDHGNIEDITVKTHTDNKVPTILIGNQPTEVNIRSLEDITPFVLRVLAETDGREES